MRPLLNMRSSEFMRFVFSGSVVLLSVFIAACSPMSSQSVAITPEATLPLTDTPSATLPATEALETSEAVEGDGTRPTLRVWWPDSLEPAGNQSAASTLD